MHTIRDKGARFGSVADVDGDGLADVLAAGEDGGASEKIAWYRRVETPDGSIDWVEHVITYPGQEQRAKDLDAADIDLDGRIELPLTTESAKDDSSANIIILEYDQAVTDTAWRRIEVSGDIHKGKLDLIELYDFDGDGDLDIMTTDENHEGVLWWENPAIPEPTSLSIVGLGTLACGRQRRHP